jgi:hypothetical protein
MSVLHPLNVNSECGTECIPLRRRALQTREKVGRRRRDCREIPNCSAEKRWLDQHLLRGYQQRRLRKRTVAQKPSRYLQEFLWGWADLKGSISESPPASTSAPGLGSWRSQRNRELLRLRISIESLKGPLSRLSLTLHEIELTEECQGELRRSIRQTT